MREIIHLQVGQCGNQVRGRLCVFDKIDRYQVLGGYQQGTSYRQHGSDESRAKRGLERVLQPSFEWSLCSSCSAYRFVFVSPSLLILGNPERWMLFAPLKWVSCSSLTISSLPRTALATTGQRVTTRREPSWWTK